MPAKSRFPGLHERNHFELISRETGKQGNYDKQDSLAIGQQRRQRHQGCRESQANGQLVDSETSTIAQGSAGFSRRGSAGRRSQNNEPDNQSMELRESQAVVGMPSQSCDASCETETERCILAARPQLDVQTHGTYASYIVFQGARRRVTSHGRRCFQVCMGTAWQGVTLSSLELRLSVGLAAFIVALSCHVCRAQWRVVCTCEH